MDRSVSQRSTKTRPREATHGRALATSIRCQLCGCRHVIETQSKNGKRDGDYMCARCGGFFSLEA